MSRRRKRHRAYQFGDNPKVRGGRDHKRVNVAEPYERHYAGIKKRSWKVRGHLQKIRGSSRKVRVRGYVAHRHIRRRKR